MQNFKRLARGVVNVKKFINGEKNFNDGINNDLARTRHLKTCNHTCEYFKDERISYLRVNDSQIPGLSDKFCDSCGCVLSYKLRIEKENCPLGKW